MKNSDQSDQYQVPYFYMKVDDTKFESVLDYSKESNNFIVTLIIVNRVFIYMSRWAVIFEF